MLTFTQYILEGVRRESRIDKALDKHIDYMKSLGREALVVKRTSTLRGNDELSPDAVKTLLNKMNASFDRKAGLVDAWNRAYSKNVRRNKKLDKDDDTYSAS